MVGRHPRDEGATSRNTFSVSSFLRTAVGRRVHAARARACNRDAFLLFELNGDDGTLTVVRHCRYGTESAARKLVVVNPCQGMPRYLNACRESAGSTIGGAGFGITGVGRHNKGL